MQFHTQDFRQERDKVKDKPDTTSKDLRDKQEASAGQRSVDQEGNK